MLPGTGQRVVRIEVVLLHRLGDLAVDVIELIGKHLAWGLTTRRQNEDANQREYLCSANTLMAQKPTDHSNQPFIHTANLEDPAFGRRDHETVSNRWACVRADFLWRFKDTDQVR